MRTVLVTGVSTGIGRAMEYRLNKSGILSSISFILSEKKYCSFKLALNLFRNSFLRF